MNGHVVSNHDRFAGIKKGLMSEVGSSLALIEELLQDLDSTKAALKSTQLDLENESDARRRLQQQIHDERAVAEVRGRRPFIVALIDADADCYFFKDGFLEKGLNGGELAADALHASLQQIARALPGGALVSEVDIVVKAFAKMSGLANALQTAGKIRGPEHLRAFAAGFSSRKPFFEFIDVGPLKEGADVKFKANAEFYLDSFQCKHLFLGCVHDEGYVSWLQQFVGDQRLADRMTLIEGQPFLQQMRKLNLKSIHLNSVFRGVPRPAPSGSIGAKFAAAIAAAGPAVSAASVATMPVAAGPNGGLRLQVQSGRLAPVVLDAAGRRVDRALHVNKAVLERIAKEELCHWLYLQGRCDIIGTASHKRNHSHRALTDEEYDALWEQARSRKCRKGSKHGHPGGDSCSDPTCFYGHRKK